MLVVAMMSEVMMHQRLCSMGWSSDGGNEQLQLGDTLPIWVNVDVTGCGSTVNYNNKTMAGTNDCLLRC